MAHSNAASEGPAKMASLSRLLYTVTHFSTISSSPHEAEAMPEPAPALPPPTRWVPAPLPPEKPAGPAPLPLRTLHTGHPSYWMYWRSLSAALLLMAGGWYSGRWENGGWWLAAGWLSGGLWLALTLLRRSSVEYRLTTRRVEVQRGFFSKSSSEIRIPDIRAITVRKTGFPGLLGVGDLSFSSAAEGEAEILFQQTPGAHRLKNRIRRLQDREA
jgi:hypothetical protein